MNRNVLLVGPKNVGKSNYLFRLWLALKSGEGGILEQDGFPKEMAYLNAGVQAQLAGEFAGRTASDVTERVEIPIKVRGEPSTLVVPDRPGEDWESLYSDRKFPPEWNDLLSSATGILFVLPANHVNDPADRLQVDRYQGPAANQTPRPDMREADPPIQTVIVDMIQLVIEQRRVLGANHRPRIGIMLTAWDRLDKEERVAGPLALLGRDHKLLSDFVRARQCDIGIEVFGSSLYGGDLSDNEFVKRFDSEDPTKLGYIVRDEDRQISEVNDLSLPVAWALEAID